MSNAKEIKRPQLTRIQQRYYDFISAYVATNGLFPTVKEIAQGVGRKSNGPVQSALLCLKYKGYINQAGDNCTARSWTLAPLPGSPSLARAKAYKVTQSQYLLQKPVPSGAYLLKKDNKFIGCWIPSEAIESKGVKS